MKFKSIVFPFLFLTLLSSGQTANSEGVTSYDGTGNKHSKNSEIDNFWYQRTTTPKEQSNKIVNLINEAIDIYIDQSYQLNSTQLLFKASPNTMISQLETLVNQSLQLFLVEHKFNGFSSAIKDTLSEIISINWGIEEYLLLGDNSYERNLVLNAFINQELDKLKQTCHLEVNQFISENKIEVSPSAWVEKQEDLKRVSYLKYQSVDFIVPIEYTLDWPVAAAANELDFTFPKSFIKGYNDYTKSAKKDKKKKKDYTAELITVIKQNSEQLKALQANLKDYYDAGIARDRDQNYAIQTQISELQNQINILNSKVDTKTYPAVEKLDYNNNIVFKNTSLTFDINSTKINNAGKIILNKVFDNLIKEPKNKVIITGYTDKSGSTDKNILLSQKRAEEVEKYLVDKGIEKKRLIVNFMGDSDSKSRNSNDRKVIIEYINKVSSIDFSYN